MITQKPVAERFPRKALPLAAALLLASLPLFAGQERSRPSDSSDTGRTAHESGSHASAPSSPPSSSSGSSSGSSNGGWTSSSSSGGDSSSARGDSGRTAHPTGPGEHGPSRQPPTHGTRGHQGGGHFGGGHYNPYYYPYGNYGGFYGYWPSLYWWWYGYDYDPYYRGGPYGPYGRPTYYGDEVGALDLDVAPGRTEVYVDGQYIGKVDAFDGWPRYLWLPKGTYDVAFYLDGYKTIARQISVYPGSVIDIDDRMEPGESVRPENLASKSHERRDERLGYERERSDRIERGQPGDDDEDWRDRVHRERGSMRSEDRDDDQDIAVQEDSHEKGRLRLDVEPEDSSVYLDGRFVGTGTDLSMMRGGLPVAAGDHRLAVVRPGHKAEEREFKVDAGEEVELDIELEDSSR